MEKESVLPYPRTGGTRVFLLQGHSEKENREKGAIGKIRAKKKKTNLSQRENKFRISRILLAAKKPAAQRQGSDHCWDHFVTLQE